MGITILQILCKKENFVLTAIIRIKGRTPIDVISCEIFMFWFQILCNWSGYLLSFGSWVEFAIYSKKFQPIFWSAATLTLLHLRPFFIEKLHYSTAF